MVNMNIRYLSGADVEAVGMAPAEILAAVEAGLQAQGQGQTVIEPRAHLIPDPAFHGHFNILRGYIAPLRVAGVKIVGDYEHNYKLGLPSEFALLVLLDTKTGAPRASAGQSRLSGTSPLTLWPVTKVTAALTSRWVTGMPA